MSEPSLTDTMDDEFLPWFVFYNLTGEYIMEFDSGEIVTVGNHYCRTIGMNQQEDVLTIVSYIVENWSLFFRTVRWRRHQEWTPEEMREKTLRILDESNSMKSHPNWMFPKVL